MKTIFLFLLFCVTASFAQQSFSIEWENITNNLEGTLTTCMIEGNNGAILIGTPFGCYRSTDKGITWGKINKGLTDKDIRALTRSATGVLFAGTVSGVFRSFDNGDTWTDVTGNIPPFDAQFFYSHPLGTVYVGVTGHIYYSNDSGATWTEFAKEITTANRTQYVASVAFGKDNRIFACFPPNIYKLAPGKPWTQIDDKGSGEIYADSSGMVFTILVSIRISNNNGDGFVSKELAYGIHGRSRLPIIIVGYSETLKKHNSNRAYSGTPILLPNQYLMYNNLCTGIDSTCLSCSNTQYAQSQSMYDKNITTLLKHSDGTFYAGSFGPIYKSTDRGKTWSKSAMGLKDPTVFTVYHDYIHSLLFITTADGVYKSKDNGKTWVECSKGFVNASVHCFAQNSKGDLFAGSQTGVYMATNEGESWVRKDTVILKNYAVTCLEVYPTGRMIAGVIENVFYESIDTGKTWQKIDKFPGYGGAVSTVTNKEKTIQYVTLYRSIFTSVNQGKDFEEERYGLNSLLVWPYVCIDSNDKVYVLERTLYSQKTLKSNWDYIIPNYLESQDSVLHWTLCANYTGDVFWGGIPGVRYYDNSAIDWYRAGNGFPNSMSTCAVLDTTGYLYTGTVGYGLLRSKKPTTYMECGQQTKPIDKAIDIPKSSVKLEWNHAPRYKNYEIQISEKNDFSDSTPLQSTKLVSYQPTNLKPNKTYYWRLRTRWGKVASDWSPVWSFTTAMQLPSRIQLISPTNNSATDTVVTLKWSKDDNAERYTCIVKESATGNVIYEDTTVTNLEITGIKTKPSTEYLWQVRAYNKIGYGEWSDVWKFTTSNSTSVVDELNNDGITISPLPVMNELIVQGLPDTSFLIEVYDAQGKRVCTSTTSSINTRNLANGSYTLGITFKNHTVYKHFVIITR